jgi:hypothetical protein
MKTQATLSAIVAAAAYSLMLVPDAFAGVIIRVPEPGTFLVLGAGAAVVAVGAWWRNRK